MLSALSLCIFGVIISVVAFKVSFCAKHRAGPWKIKKQTGIWEGNNFSRRREDSTVRLLFRTYFCFSTSSKGTDEDGRPPSVLLPKEATEAFSPGTRKGNLFAFQVSSPPIEMKGKLKWVIPTSRPSKNGLLYPRSSEPFKTRRSGLKSV